MNMPFLHSLPAGFSRATLVFILAITTQAAVAGTVVVEDSFALDGSLRTEGASLGGLSSTTGSGTWKVHDAIAPVFARSGGITNTTSKDGIPQNAEARIALLPPQEATTVSAEFTTGDGIGWVAIGFAAGGTPSGGNWLSSNPAQPSRAVLWAYVSPKGTWELFANGTTTRLANGSVKGFSKAGTYALELAYDPAAGTADLALVSSGSVKTRLHKGDVSRHVAASSIAAAGFRIHLAGKATTAGEAKLHNFRITTAAGPSREPHPFVTRLAAGTPQKIVFYGTSLTAEGEWVPQLRGVLEARFPGLVTFANGAGSGMNSRWGADNIDANVLVHRPDVVFIEFSVNDAVARFDLSPDESRRNLDMMLNRIWQANPGTDVILQVMNPILGRPPGHAGHRRDLPLYQDVYREVGAVHGLLVIDHMPAWTALLESDARTFRAWVPDGLHPRAEGYARVVIPEILRRLGLAGASPVTGSQ